MLEKIYLTGEYLEKNPGWHIEESPWKANQVLQMMARHHITPATICEIGCGAGEILRQLQTRMVGECSFWGYDISPQALTLAQTRANERLHFKLADITQESDLSFDVILVLDVIEHLEDPFSFLRNIRSKSQYKIFHIPLDVSVQTLLRPGALTRVRSMYGHLHYFTKETALQTLRDTGYTILDYRYTASSIELPATELSRKLLKWPRKCAFTLNKHIAARVLGGFRLLVLAQ
jgi:hypothetical protein